ncbi:hypothetical protein SBV1_1170014 [Verrucomicrobia bacterium]|nr:hypothetical protein SBV1_1170014 [Verrucomicrobiota bacterium]
MSHEISYWKLCFGNLFEITLARLAVRVGGANRISRDELRTVTDRGALGRRKSLFAWRNRPAREIIGVSADGVGKLRAV